MEIDTYLGRAVLSELSSLGKLAWILFFFPLNMPDFPLEMPLRGAFFPLAVPVINY